MPRWSATTTSAWTGRATPHGIGGKEIRLETRIISTADVFDALTAERPYRGAMPLPKALGIMEGDISSAFDPDCFAALRSARARLEKAA